MNKNDVGKMLNIGILGLYNSESMTEYQNII